MLLFDWIQRKRHAKGYGIHSPFAFWLVRTALYSRHTFYAFGDIEKHLRRNKIKPEVITELNHLSFRLVHYLKARHILEIHSSSGVNTLFVTSPHSEIRCVCIEPDATKIADARALHHNNNISYHSTMQEIAGQKFDAIFIYVENEEIPPIDTLLHFSHPNTFWVIAPIRGKMTKQFWRNIVKDNRARVVFDMTHVGVVFWNPTFLKKKYKV